MVCLRIACTDLPYASKSLLMFVPAMSDLLDESFLALMAGE